MSTLLVQNLKKSYVTPDGDTVPVVSVPSFELKKAEQAALEGESGCGKTTFLNLIAGILRPDSGQIVIGGQDISLLPESERDRVRANKIGYIFQSFNLLQGYTAIENVELGMHFGSGVDNDRAHRLLDRVGLSHRTGYRPRQLSIGQQQRVAVARALANSPELVLADEPTGNLDHTSAIEALELIRATCTEQGAALLLVSHDREILSRFENVRRFADINRIPETAADRTGSL